MRLPTASRLGIITEADALRVLKPLHTCLYAVVESAWRDFQAMSPGLVRPHMRWKTTTMHEFMVQHARARLDGVQGVALVEGNRFLASVEDTLLLRFKKLDQTLRTSNYPTPTAQRFDAQLPLASLLSPRLPRVTVGYQPRRDWTELIAVTVVHSVGKHVQWFYDLDSEEQSQTVLPAQPLPDTVIVRPRPQLRIFNDGRNASEKK